jgi:threonine synthase
VRAARGGIIARYFEHLPVTEATPIVSLGEGGTPLVYSERLSAETGAKVWLKCEGLNPTASFKDRGMTVAVSKAVEDGARAVICASTGNTSASAAAYAGRTGITCGVLVPRGAVAHGKIAQTLAHGGRVLEIDGGFDDAFELTRRLDGAEGVTLVNSINPFRLEGQKTAAFEIVEQLGRAPEEHFMPVGNAGNITAYWKGYREAKGEGWCDTLPRMWGWQAEGAAPIVRGEPVAAPETVASAIRIGNPAGWKGALAAAGESGGSISSVTDDEILSAYRSLALEGVFAEPASAAGVAGLRRAAAGEALTGRTVVCVLTGHGLKDPETAVRSGAAPQRVPADPAAVLRALDL